MNKKNDYWNLWVVDLLTAELKDNTKWNDENGVKAILKECSKSK